MSLINEALKRAESEKLGKLLMTSGAKPLTPVHRKPAIKIPIGWKIRPWLRKHASTVTIAAATVMCIVLVLCLANADPEAPLAMTAQLASAATVQDISPSHESAVNATGDNQQLTEALKQLTTSTGNATPQQVNTAKFVVSAIMLGDDGGTAIINGKFVSLGQTIDGAKVIKIDHYSVELEASGHRFSIRM